MKALKTLFSVALFGMATSMSANNLVESASVAPSASAGENYQKVSISYNASSLKYDGGSESWGGFDMGYIYGISVSQAHPMFVEVGGSIQFRKDEDLKMTSLNIPVNFVYKFDVAEDFAIKPLVGIDLRLNMFGSEGLFDKNVMDCGRFQAGWHLGAQFEYKKFELGVTYGQDFNEITDELRVTNTLISVGYNF